MLCIGLIHGDLSEFNVLVAPDGPVIIDLPQVVNAAGNNAARAMLERDVNNLRPRSVASHRSCSPPSSPGKCGRCSSRANCDRRPNSLESSRADETVVDPDDVMLVIDDAREEEIQRRLRLVSQPLAAF